MGNAFINAISMAAGKIGRQRHLGAIRDGFITMMPLMIVGSLVTLINNIPIGTQDGQVLKTLLAEIPALAWIVSLNGNVWWGTFGMITIFAVISISYYLAKSYSSDSLSAAVVSLACFLSAVPQMAIFTNDLGEQAGWGFINYGYVNATGLFVGIIIALCATEVFVRLAKTDKLIIKMPEGVPPAVSRSFAALFPGMLTVLIVSFVTVMISIVSNSNVFDLVKDVVLAPLTSASGSIGFGLVIVFLTHLLWSFGIHGPNIFEGILQPLNLTAIEKNLSVLGGAAGSYVIFNKSFADAYVYMGGSGVGLGLIIAILLVGKHKQHRMVGRLGLAPGLFNINEPVIFGLPIVLNPIFVIPFIIAPIICLLIAYGATSIGFLPPAQAVIPWTTPPILSGLFVSGFSWRGPVIQIINLAISIGIYIPFVMAADKIEMRKEAEQEAKAFEAVKA